MRTDVGELHDDLNDGRDDAKTKQTNEEIGELEGDGIADLMLKRIKIASGAVLIATERTRIFDGVMGAMAVGANGFAEIMLHKRRKSITFFYPYGYKRQKFLCALVRIGR